MFKRLLILLLLIPATGWAISLGNLDVHSHLNQPLQAKITLSDLGNIPAEQVQITLASQMEFARAHMAKTNVVRALQFKMIHVPNQAAYIQVTTLQRVNEPFISFLLHVSWPKGDYIKKYILLLDPAAIKPPAKLMVTEHKATTTVQRNIPKIVDHVYGPTEKGQHLWAIAKQVRPAKTVTIAQTMLALVQYNPNAFLLHNVNGLMDGYYLRIPTQLQIKATSSAVALKQIKQHNRYWKLKKRVPISLKARTAPVQQAKLQRITVAAKNVAEIAKSPGLAQPPGIAEKPAAEVSMAVKTPQQSITEDAIISLRAELDAALKSNEMLKQKHDSIEQQLLQLQQQNQQLQTSLTNSKQSTIRLQQLLNSQAKTVVQSKKTSVGIGSWLRKNWGLVLGAFAIIALLIVFVLNRRRTKTPNGNEPDSVTTVKETVTVDIPDELNDASLDVETEVEHDEPDISINKVEKTETEASVNISDVLPDVTVKEIRRSHPEVGEGDNIDITALLEEAKLYVDYGRHEQAIDMLHKAINSHPSDIFQWETLLRIVTDLDDKKLFGAAVAKIPAELLNADEQALWQTVESLRANFKTTASSTEEEKAPDTEHAQQNEPEINDEAKITLSPLSSEESAQLNAVDDAEKGDAKDQINLDLAAESDGMSLKLTEDDDLDITIETDSPEQQNSHDIIANEDSDMSKLDLIRAYIEMGDNDSAKKLLTEIIKFGKPTSKQQAEQLLAKLAE